MTDGTLAELTFCTVAGLGMETLSQSLQAVDAKKDGRVFLDHFVQVLDKYDTQLDEDELMALVNVRWPPWNAICGARVRDLGCYDCVAVHGLSCPLFAWSVLLSGKGNPCWQGNPC